MKTLIYILATVIFSNSICFAQIPQDYPFKTYLDEAGNLYMTGVENGDIVTFKYRPEIRYTMIPNGLKFMTIQDMTEAMI